MQLQQHDFANPFGFSSVIIQSTITILRHHCPVSFVIHQQTCFLTFYVDMRMQSTRAPLVAVIWGAKRRHPEFTSVFELTQIWTPNFTFPRPSSMPHTSARKIPAEAVINPSTVTSCLPISTKIRVCGQWRIHGGGGSPEGPRTLPWLQAGPYFSPSGAPFLVASVSVSGYYHSTLFKR